MADSIDPTATRDYRPHPVGKARGPANKTAISITGDEVATGSSSDKLDIRGTKPLVSPEEMQKYVTQLMEMDDSETLPGREAIVADAKYRYEQGDYSSDAFTKTVDGLLDDLRPLFSEDSSSDDGAEA